MTILGILKLAGGCLLPPQPPEKGESWAGTPQTRLRDVHPIPLLIPAPTARGRGGGGLGIPGGRPGRVYPWGLLRQRAPKGCAQPKYYIESPSWVEKGSWGCNDAPCSEPHPSGRTVMLRIPSALASHAFYSVPC